MKVEVWSDVACPWCYIGKVRFERAVAEFGKPVDVTYRSYQLDPSLPAHDPRGEVDYLVERKGMSRDQVLAMIAHVTDAAAGEGLTFDFDRLVVANSFTAHRLLHHAKGARPASRAASGRIVLRSYNEPGRSRASNPFSPSARPRTSGES